MNELDDAKRDLENAAVRFENGAAGWRLYALQLNAKLDGTELQNSFLVQQIKLLSVEPRPDPLDINAKKNLFEQKLKKRKDKQREQIQNELLPLMPLVFIDPIIFKNGD